jgi:hypothetical protein
LLESKLVGSSLAAMKTIIAAIVIAVAAVLLLASLKSDNRIAPGKRTEGLCPPFCETTLIAMGKHTDGQPFCPPFCDPVVRYATAKRNQELIEADLARFPRDPAHFGGRSE